MVSLLLKLLSLQEKQSERLGNGNIFGAGITIIPHTVPIPQDLASTWQLADAQSIFEERIYEWMNAQLSAWGKGYICETFGGWISQAYGTVDELSSFPFFPERIVLSSFPYFLTGADFFNSIISFLEWLQIYRKIEKIAQSSHRSPHLFPIISILCECGIFIITVNQHGFVIAS